MNNPKIINYFESDNKDHWLLELSKCDWGAGKYLCSLLKDEELFSLVGKGARVLMLVDEDELLSFCTLAPLDDVQPTDLSPWVGFAYTFPRHRGKRLLGKLLSFAEKLAAKEGASYVHISTNHVGLYEKYGYGFYAEMKDVEGENTRVYVKNIQ